MCRECTRQQVRIKDAVYRRAAKRLGLKICRNNYAGIDLSNDWGGLSNTQRRLEVREQLIIDARDGVWNAPPNTTKRYPPKYPSRTIPHKAPDPYQHMLNENTRISLTEYAPPMYPVQPKNQFIYGAVDLQDRRTSETKMGASSDPAKRTASNSMSFQKRNRAEIVLMFKIPIGKMSLHQRNDVEEHIRTLLGPALLFDGPREWHARPWEYVYKLCKKFRMCGPIYGWNIELLRWYP